MKQELVTVRKEEGKCIMQFHVDLIAEHASVFQELYNTYKNEINFVLDFDIVKKVDSTGLGMMMEMRDIVGSKGNITIINASKDLKQLLNNLHIDRLFNIE